MVVGSSSSSSSCSTATRRGRRRAHRNTPVVSRKSATNPLLHNAPVSVPAPTHIHTQPSDIQISSSVTSRRQRRHTMEFKHPAIDRAYELSLIQQQHLNSRHSNADTCHIVIGVDE